jgi:mono/diheme cytochrome c family protein
VISEHAYRKLYQNLTLVGGGVALVVLTVMATDPGRDSEWEGFQRALRDTLLARATTAHDTTSANEFALEIREVALGVDSRVDRCITCHLGVNFPGLTGIPQPLREHSGSHLLIHSLEKLGCTLCHGGNGRDVTVQAPCTAERLGNPPRESLRFVESSCGRCHGEVFDTTAIVGAPVLEQGREIFRTGGCLGCHRLRMVGGTLGPDLTDQGRKSSSHYSFQNVPGIPSIPAWLREHFLNPARISPGSLMPPVRASAEEIDALITFMLSLHTLDLPAEYYALPVLAECRGNRRHFGGSEAYALLCRACHGTGGRGMSYDSSQVGAPALGSVGFQAVASDDFIRFTLIEGRGPRLMASWRPVLSGLKGEELEDIFRSLRRWKAEARPWQTVRTAKGSRHEGSRLYASTCAPCHGVQREGGIGPGLGNSGFLALATDRFIYTTIALGRQNTAMPSWSHLNDGELVSLVRFLRGDTPFTGGEAGLSSAIEDSARGGILFASYCARCHGAHGEGGIGPAILNPDFLAAADDEFLAGTILQGRAHTPMFGWSQAGVHVSGTDVSSILGYMRTMATGIADRIYPGAVLGRPQQGRERYREHCRECHGVNGEGVKGPSLNNQEFLNAASNGFLLATITVGRPGTAMPAWGRAEADRPALSQRERLDLVAFVRVWQTDVIEPGWHRVAPGAPHHGDIPGAPAVQ